MARATQFANAEKLTQSGRKTRFSSSKDFNSLLEDLLLDDGFDQIGRLDYGGAEFDIYRELKALPRE
jgi:hypothetical protein